MATRVVCAGMTAAGFDVVVDGTQWELTPRTAWSDTAGVADADDIPALDAEGVTLTVTLDDQSRTARAVATGPSRFAVDAGTIEPFSVPAKPGAAMRFTVRAACTHRPNGRALLAPLRRTLVDGFFEVPDEVHDLGAQGTGLVPNVLGGEAPYAFLHLASVEGNRRYVATHLTFTLARDS